MAKFNENLVRLMAERGVNQVQLAEGVAAMDIKIPQSLISMWVRNEPRAQNPSIKKAGAIARFLGVTVDELLGTGKTLSSAEYRFLKTFERNLNRILADRDMNQSDLGRLCESEINQSTISRYCRASETGVIPGLYHIFIITRKLGISITDLTENPKHRAAEECAEKLENPTAEEIALLDAYKNMDPDDPRRQAIDKLLLGIKKRD